MRHPAAPNKHSTMDKMKIDLLKKIEPLDIMRYYVTYMDIEKQILLDIEDRKPQIRERAYNRYVNQHMKIGRNFRSGVCHMVLGATLNYLKLGKGDVEELSKIYFSNGLLNKRIKNATVAASKLIWLYVQETIIMDGEAIKFLGAKNYENFIIKWIEMFEIKEPEIIDVIENCFKNIDPVMEEKWFRMRVFDQFILAQQKAKYLTS